MEYCVQYRETDLDFVSRLLEEEGIFYFFEHGDTKHLLVFADGTVAYKEIAGESGVTYNFSQGMAPSEECVYRFAFSRQVRSGKMTRRDYNFEKPGLDLTKDEQAKVYEKREVYDYPGRYVEPDRGKQLSKVWLEESMTYYETAEGRARACGWFRGSSSRFRTTSGGVQPGLLPDEVGHSRGAAAVAARRRRDRGAGVSAIRTVSRRSRRRFRSARRGCRRSRWWRIRRRR